MWNILPVLRGKRGNLHQGNESESGSSKFEKVDKVNLFLLKISVHICRNVRVTLVSLLMHHPDSVRLGIV